MSTWLDDITDPEERAAYQLVGNQPDEALRNMVRALEGPFRWMNTPQDNARLKAAKYILKKRRMRANLAQAQTKKATRA